MFSQKNLAIIEAAIARAKETIKTDDLDGGELREADEANNEIAWDIVDMLLSIDDKAPEPTCFCAECGGTRVSGTEWYDLNTGEPTGDDAPLDDFWCDDCESHTRVVDERPTP